MEEQAGTDGVHAAHCCAKHGCKYGNDACPVQAGNAVQEHPCEFCDMDDEDAKPVVDKIVKWLEGRVTAQQEQAVRALQAGDASTYHRRVVKAVVLADVVRGLREGAWKA